MPTKTHGQQRIHRLAMLKGWTLLACSVAAAAAFSASTTHRLPNILFILTDQQRHDTLEDTLAPNILALAAEGAMFTTAYVSTPVCTPCRAALLTGRSPWNHGMLGYGEIAPKYKRELPRELAAAGYKTAVIGKNHFGWDKKSNKGVSHGFESLQIYDGLKVDDDYDQWFQIQRPGENPLKTGGLAWNDWRAAAYVFEEYLHPTAWTGRQAVQAVHDLAKAGRPFFLKVSFHRPHSPYDPPKRFLDSTPQLQKPPAVTSGGWDSKYRDCSDRGEHDHWCGEASPSDLNLTRRAYHALIQQVDEQIGEILAAVRAEGIYNHTFILFTSDHGDQQMDHYLWKKGYAYEGSTHVPLIIRWPESMDANVSVSRGSRIGAVVEIRDVLPTFMAVAGCWHLQDEIDFDGRPLTWLLQGRSQDWRQWIDMENSIFYQGSWNALTDGKIKYIFHADSGNEQLFNLTSDPSEIHDLAQHDGFKDLLAVWRARLVKQFKDEDRGFGWVQGDSLARRPLLPCLYGHNYPDWNEKKFLCSVISSLSVYGLIGACIALLVLHLILLCITCCFLRRKCRQRNRNLQFSTIQLIAADNPQESSATVQHSVIKNPQQL